MAFTFHSIAVGLRDLGIGLASMRLDPFGRQAVLTLRFRIGVRHLDLDEVADDPLERGFRNAMLYAGFRQLTEHRIVQLYALRPLDLIALGILRHADRAVERRHLLGLGTFAGLRVNNHAQVLDARGQPIAGLYAAGNDMNSLMAGHYPSGGITLGPAMVFGWLAAHRMASPA